ncbi:AP-4 complex subunit sigma-1 [Aplysia californica]|uniref:AP complex subunit sigma n=1 Tax=Aplysia californica TaxID=6500 RepID=A0ABM0JSK0_APLCA|nr:AP-4 complex subunit sigma-1 [Aplysia californica]
MIQFCVIANKQGRIRLRRIYEHIEEKNQHELELAVVGKCLSRSSKQCNFFYHDHLTVVYKKFTTLCFICVVTKDENELAMQEILNVFMDCLVAYFHHVSELDIVFNIEKVYLILDEIIVNGCVGFTSKERVLVPLQLLEAGS